MVDNMKKQVKEGKARKRGEEAGGREEGEKASGLDNSPRQGEQQGGRREEDIVNTSRGLDHAHEYAQMFHQCQVGPAAGHGPAQLEIAEYISNEHARAGNSLSFQTT